MSVPVRPSAEPGDDELLELRDVWLSRLMFNMFVGWAPETRSFEEFVRDHREAAA